MTTYGPNDSKRHSGHETHMHLVPAWVKKKVII